MWRRRSGLKRAVQARAAAELSSSPVEARAGWAACSLFPSKARRRLIGVDTSGFGVIVGNIWATNLIPETGESSPTAA